MVTWSEELLLLVTWNHTAVCKLFVLDRNTWYPIIVRKLFVLDRNTWCHITVCKLFVLDKNTLSYNHMQNKIP